MVTTPLSAAGTIAGAIALPLSAAGTLSSALSVTGAAALPLTLAIAVTLTIAVAGHILCRVRVERCDPVVDLTHGQSLHVLSSDAGVKRLQLQERLIFAEGSPDSCACSISSVLAA